MSQQSPYFDSQSNQSWVPASTEPHAAPTSPAAAQKRPKTWIWLLLGALALMLAAAGVTWLLVGGGQSERSEALELHEQQVTAYEESWSRLQQQVDASDQLMSVIADEQLLTQEETADLLRCLDEATAIDPIEPGIFTNESSVEEIRSDTERLEEAVFQVDTAGDELAREHAVVEEAAEVARDEDAIAQAEERERVAEEQRQREEAEVALESVRHTVQGVNGTWCVAPDSAEFSPISTCYTIDLPNVTLSDTGEVMDIEGRASEGAAGCFIFMAGDFSAIGTMPSAIYPFGEYCPEGISLSDPNFTGADYTDQDVIYSGQSGMLLLRD